MWGGRMTSCVAVPTKKHFKLTQKDVSDGEVDEQVVSGCPGPFCARARHQEEEIPDDGDHDRHDVQRDPAPLKCKWHFTARI